MNKIQRASYLLHLLFKILYWATPLATVYLIVFNIEGMMNWGAWSSIISANKIQSYNYSPVHRLVILAIQAIPLSITVLIFRNLSKLFGLYAQGKLFEQENIKLIKGISIYMIVGELVQLMYQPLITAALSFANPAGQRFASITLGTTNATTLMTSVIILVASWIIKEANQLKSDSQLTI